MIGHWVSLGDPRLVPAKGGHINASFFIADGIAPPRWLLQRVNRQVFPSPELVMRNIEVVLGGAARETGTGIDLPVLLRTPSGLGWVNDDDGEFWRCWEVVPGLRSSARVGSVQDAGEAGRAFGAFARIGTVLDAGRLVETIPGFHDTPARLRRLEASIERNASGRADRAREEIALALHYRALAPLLAAPLASGAIPVRVAHNDAKVANVLFDAASGRAAMVIDLDTVMPGTPLFDFGDLVRSSVSTAAEDATALGQVQAEPELYRALLEGYLAGIGGLLTPAERQLLEPAGRVITWEQAIRFLTDYLDGDIYFATAHREHNLERTRAQLALLTSLDAQQDANRKLVQGARA
jgi:Ser/Thr protein kinase RdoA (MazF antagonist)